MIGALAKALVEPLARGLLRFIPDPNTRREAAEALARQVETQSHEQIMAQVAVNQGEAGHPSLFVAGWRPFIGWVCGAAMAFNFVAIPLLNYAQAVFGVDGAVPAPLDLEVMLPVLLGMLGLGGMRSYEKRSGVARAR